MSRYIDANEFDERVRISVGLVEEELTEDYKDGVRCTLEMLKTQPTADVVEVKHGEWKYDGTYYICSACSGNSYMNGFNYCPYCGADMKGGE